MMGRTALLLLFLSLQQPGCVHTQPGLCSSRFQGLPPELTVDEGTPEGTVLLKSLRDMELVRYSKPHPPPFLGLQNDSLYLNASLQLDNQQALCKDFLNQGFRWKIFLRCRGTIETKTIIIKVRLTDDYPPQFTSNITKEIQEMAMVGTEVLRVQPDQITDRDCASSFPFGSAYFVIEEGNRNQAFRLTSPRVSRIEVARWLDYERGDRHFLLNISISHVNHQERKSYTTLEVQVLDIDDNDPVFDNSDYELRVNEEDMSSLEVWVNTVPPISVSDPDKNVSQQDPLFIGLYDSSDSSVVELNSRTGQVKLKRTFDREQQSSYSVILKVQQSINWWRSSTVTLTIIVDDVNDHFPLFSQTTHDVTVAEHALAGTSVARVMATDADLGTNAFFKYTLESGTTQAFSLQERVFGGKVYCFLLVRNPVLLDRETSPQITVTIGTGEHGGAPIPEGCGDERCQTLVRITLLDINDHSPVFDQKSYFFHVDSSVSPAPPKAVVKAEDPDSGPNAEVSYAISEVSKGRCRGVTINSLSGVVLFNPSVVRLEQCFMFVTACDSPAQESERRCSAVPVTVSAEIIPDDQAMFEAPVSPITLFGQNAVLEEELGKILNTTVRIRRIANAPMPGWSAIFISATNSTSQEPILKEELKRMLKENHQKIATLFDRYLVVSKTKDRDIEEVSGLSTPAIGLLCVSAALLCSLLVAAVALGNARKKDKKQQQLIEQIFSSSYIVYDDGNLPDTVGSDVSSDTSNASSASSASTATSIQSPTPPTPLNQAPIPTLATTAAAAVAAAAAPVAAVGNSAPAGSNSPRSARENDRALKIESAVLHPRNVGNSTSVMRTETTIPYGEDAYWISSESPGASERASTPRSEGGREGQTTGTKPVTDSGHPSNRETGRGEQSQPMFPVITRKGSASSEDSSSEYGSSEVRDTALLYGDATGNNRSANSTTDEDPGAASDTTPPQPEPQNSDLNTDSDSQRQGRDRNQDAFMEVLGDLKSQLSKRRADSPTRTSDENPVAGEIGKLEDLPRPGALFQPAPSGNGTGDEDTLPEKPEPGTGIEDTLPEEPEPDYGKKVRFTANTFDTDNNNKNVESNEESEKGRESDTDTVDFVNPLAHPEALGDENDEADNSSPVFWNIPEEMTSL